MASFTGWIAKHTGLPSFKITAALGERVEIIGETDSDKWTAVAFVGTGRTAYISDPFAPPEIETRYRLANSTHAQTLKRRAPSVANTGSDDWWRGIITTADGRILDALAWEADGDVTEWKSEAHMFNPNVVRWPLNNSTPTGSGTFILYDPKLETETWRMLQSSQPLILHPASPTPALPKRAIVVETVTRKRLTGNGVLEFSVKWSTIPLDSPMLRGANDEVGIHIITWGAWNEFDHSWKRRSYQELLREIAGMP